MSGGPGLLPLIPKRRQCFPAANDGQSEQIGRCPIDGMGVGTDLQPRGASSWAADVARGAFVVVKRYGFIESGFPNWRRFSKRESVDKAEQGSALSSLARKEGPDFTKGIDHRSGHLRARTEYRLFGGRCPPCKKTSIHGGLQGCILDLAQHGAGGKEASPGRNGDQCLTIWKGEDHGRIAT